MDMELLVSGSSPCTIFHGLFLPKYSLSILFYFKHCNRREDHFRLVPADCRVQGPFSTKSAAGSCKAHCCEQHKVSVFLLLHAHRRKIVRAKVSRTHLIDAKKKIKNFDVRLGGITSEECSS